MILPTDLNLQFARWFRGSHAVDSKGNPQLVFRGEHGPFYESSTRAFNLEPTIQSRLGATSFGSKSAAIHYATFPNMNYDVPIKPRILSCFLQIRKPFINRLEDPFVEVSEIARALGEKTAIGIAYSMRNYIMHTARWHDDIGNEFENFDDYFRSPKFNIDSLYFDAYSLFDHHGFVSMFRNAGYDGAIHCGCGITFGQPEYKVFSRSQIWQVCLDIIN